MDNFDLKLQEKDVLGGIDRLLINVGMAIIAFIPTYFILIFRPSRMAYMLSGEEPDGRKGLILGPGIMFVFSVLFTIGLAYILKDVAKVDVAPTETVNNGPKGGGIRTALSEGNFWRSIILTLPFYFVALLIGVIFQIVHLICGQKTNLTKAVGVGLYALSTFLPIIFLTVPTNNLVKKEYAAAYVGSMIVGLFVIIFPWQFYSFSRVAFKNEKGGAIAVSALTCLLVLVTLVLFGIVGSTLNSD